ncbi:MAG: transcription termination/antitermination protein NusG [Prevotellaceae bacterium]|jgi:transcriptional antiterminator NusG|nr:transcription termination/antitermination protein NusG [Prevotellaceae bacterium]
MAEETGKKWYVLRSVGGKEKKVKEYIENEIRSMHLENYVTQVLIPTEKIYQIKNGKKVSTERIFYAGYVFVEAILEGEVVHVLRNIPNVAGFLSETKGGDPVPLRAAEVNRILGHIDRLSENSGEEIATPFFVGEPVKVIDGPFNGFSGTIEEIYEEKKKLKVMVKIFSAQWRKHGLTDVSMVRHLP